MCGGECEGSSDAVFIAVSGEGGGEKGGTAEKILSFAVDIAINA